MAPQNAPRIVDEAMRTTTGTAPGELFQQGIQAVEELMYAVVETDVSILTEASRHILKAGGKRVRPRMVLLSYIALGGTDIDYVVPAAAAIELVHTASVVHDDINDHGVLRRGRPSINSIWGRTFALLTGDFLFTKVYELMAPYKDLNIDLAEATIALVEGETLQASAVKEGKFSRQIYHDIISRKTAALFRSGAVIGAKLAGASAKEIDALADYGFKIGLAFQIIDDILDLVADAETLGKTAGIDLEQGKGFAVHATAAPTANANGAGSNIVDSGDPMLVIKQKLLQGDAIPEARQQAKVLASQAVDSIDLLPASFEKDELVKLAHLVVDRDH
ncbi:MAG: polyprenyl synthetase family protein [Chloroflexi bacterium]|nr:MAG: hypothetical protein CUN54_04780 [Phototrophicales bacterium]RMF82354.1 MAG: polyprenyl synthetase family protein [Chloroflexota bacterium]